MGTTGPNALARKQSRELATKIHNRCGLGVNDFNSFTFVSRKSFHY